MNMLDPMSPNAVKGEMLAPDAEHTQTALSPLPDPNSAQHVFLADSTPEGYTEPGAPQ